MSHLNLKRRLASEAGFVLPTAIIVLFILTVLTGAAIALASQTSTSTTRDDNTKAALEAAEAGLRVASYRLGALKPAEAKCITKSVEAAPESGYCKDAEPESLGNGSTFQYWTTPGLKVSEKCAGQTVSAIVAGTVQRCVISEGKVNGISQRLTVRVETAAGESLFQVAGVVGLKEVKITGSVKVPAVVASNEKIIGEGSANFESGFELCPPKGTFSPAAGTERNKSGVTINGVGKMESNPSLEKTRSAAECPLKAELPAGHPTELSNEDSRIGTTDPLVGGTWSEAKHELTLESTNELTLSGSRYYFCNFKMPGGGPKFKIAPTAKVEIFIDSPEDPASKCAAGTGKFEIAGGSKTENEGKNPANLLIEIYGKGPFKFANGSGKTLEAAIFAPNGEVNMEGGVQFSGGIVGDTVHLENGTRYGWSETVKSLTNGTAGAYGRKAWEQCTPTGTTPQEGC
jgi:Tfp pilus assembly protein PilX